MHSVAKFGGDPFNLAKYQRQMIGFVGGHAQGMEPVAIIVEDDAWKWIDAKVMTNPILLAINPRIPLSGTFARPLRPELGKS